MKSIQGQTYSKLEIILVDDGSKAENKKFFPSGDDITLLTHERNFGKGQALKTALKYVIENRDSLIEVVNAHMDRAA